MYGQNRATSFVYKTRFHFFFKEEEPHVTEKPTAFLSLNTTKREVLAMPSIPLLASDNVISDEGAKAFGQALTKNSTLQVLVLYGVSQTARGGQSTARAFSFFCFCFFLFRLGKVVIQNKYIEEFIKAWTMDSSVWIHVKPFLWSEWFRIKWFRANYSPPKVL